MKAARKRLSVWPGMVFVLIGMNFCVVGLTVYSAHTRGQTFAIESDYDRKALRWDETVRQQAANERLGWSVRVTAIGGERMEVAVVDRDGAPLMDADITVEMFHHARAGDPRAATLRPSGEGRYAADIGTQAPGLWELRFVVRRGGEVFTSAFTRAVSGGGS